MKPSELRDKSAEELQSLESELRGKIVKLRVSQATSRRVNVAMFSELRRDVARIKTIQSERKLGLDRE